ncbi:hypothetical protein ACJX0J_012104, partial [Zea mays]
MSDIVRAAEGLWVCAYVIWGLENAYLWVQSEFIISSICVQLQNPVFGGEQINCFGLLAIISSFIPYNGTIPFCQPSLSHLSMYAVPNEFSCAEVVGLTSCGTPLSFLVGHRVAAI